MVHMVNIIPAEYSHTEQRAWLWTFSLVLALLTQQYSNACLFEYIRNTLESTTQSTGVNIHHTKHSSGLMDTSSNIEVCTQRLRILLLICMTHMMAM